MASSSEQRAWWLVQTSNRTTWKDSSWKPVRLSISFLLTVTFKFILQLDMHFLGRVKRSSFGFVTTLCLATSGSASAVCANSTPNRRVRRVTSVVCAASWFNSNKALSSSLSDVFVFCHYLVNDIHWLVCKNSRNVSRCLFRFMLEVRCFVNLVARLVLPAS